MSLVGQTIMKPIPEHFLPAIERLVWPTGIGVAGVVLTATVPAQLGGNEVCDVVSLHRGGETNVRFGRLGTVRPGIMIGGLAINRFNQLAEMAGADAFCTDAQAALATANQVIRGRKAIS